MAKSTCPRSKSVATRSESPRRTRGKRTGRLYEVVIKASIAKYPNEEPALYMRPHPERHHWIGDGRLCYLRRGHVWNPAEDTFAQAVIIAAKYVDEFDGRG